MNNQERKYFKSLIDDTNELIKAVYNNTCSYRVYKTDAERRAFIEGLSAALKPFAYYLVEEVAHVDLTRLPQRRITTPRGSFRYDPMSEQEAHADGWNFHHEHGDFLIMVKNNRAIAIDKLP